MFEYLSYLFGTIIALIPGPVQEPEPVIVTASEVVTEIEAVQDEAPIIATTSTGSAETVEPPDITPVETAVAVKTGETENAIVKNEVIKEPYMWKQYVKPSTDVLKGQLSELAFKVTQKDGTERSNSSPLDKNYEDGIYVDILSGEPLFSSRDKFDSGTGWPSFTQPIENGAVTEHKDFKLILPRTEIRSAIADNHLGHVFTDGPKDSTGLRYCMNGVALRFVPKDMMEAEGYGDYLQYL